MVEDKKADRDETHEEGGTDLKKVVESQGPPPPPSDPGKVSAVFNMS